MPNPILADYTRVMMRLFDRFMQTEPVVMRHANLCTYGHRELLIFFVMMQFRKISKFKTQARWLEAHPEVRELLRFEVTPHRTTLSRRYKALYEVVTDFAAFVGEDVSQIAKAFAHHHLVEDKSLFKAAGPVWHQSDRKEGRIPPKLRRLDTDATWSKSGYQGWVYGYGLHLTCTEDAFPKLVQVETAAVADSDVLDQKAAHILDQLQPETLTADDGYTKAMRIRRWIQNGVILVTPALRWRNGRYAQAYHRFLQQPDIKGRFKRRKTSVEPLFDLLAKVMGIHAYQKQLPVQKLANVRTALALAVLSVQISMIVNNIWGLPLREVANIIAAFS